MKKAAQKTPGRPRRGAPPKDKGGPRPDPPPPSSFRPKAALLLFPKPGYHPSLFREDLPGAVRQLRCKRGGLVVLKADREVVVFDREKEDHGCQSPIPRPKSFKLKKNARVDSLDCGVSQILLLSSEGKLYEHPIASGRIKSEPRWHTLVYVPALGEVFSFGLGAEGQLGNGKNSDQLIPLPLDLTMNGQKIILGGSSKEVVKIIAGESQSIVLLLKEKNSYADSNRTLPKVEEEKVEKWLSNSDPKCWKNIQQEIKLIFSSAACINGSFLDKRGKHFTTSWKTAGVDLSAVFLFYEKIAAKSKVLTQVINGLKKLLNSLHPPPASPEALRVFLVVPILLRKQDIKSDSLLNQLAQIICLLSQQAKGILECFWSNIEVTFFKDLVSLYQKLVSVKMSAFIDLQRSSDNAISTGELMWSIQVLQMLYEQKLSKVVVKQHLSALHFQHIHILSRAEEYCEDRRKEYVEAYIDHVFTVSVKKQFEDFMRGFERGCPVDTWKMFLPAELRVVLLGHRKYDWEQLEKNARYSGYEESDETIKDFWAVFHDLDEESKKKFLAFLTGTDCIPAQGMEKFTFTIADAKKTDPDQWYPVACTCLKVFRLPRYTNRDVLKKRVLCALEWFEKFGLP
ncbi:hypothetical protein JRQ81_016905 [Phrynocephalus forsythii]|uniref:HECT-type E3 ubiquitin transferase n=1 Tax=Phrynocephalus forsythii TaxID=171643 RepID=A0A9Q0XT44_9SAUR|nr:hypothetical protein JRQ81_016905 [Phrynocephalus forsythii]